MRRIPEIDEVKTSVSVLQASRNRRRWIPLVAGLAIVAVAVVAIVRGRDSEESVATQEQTARPVREPEKPPVVPVHPGEAPARLAPSPSEEIAMEPTHVGRPAPANDTAKKPTPTKAPETGLFSIDSDPYAEIFVDGVSFGPTPVLKRSLTAGRHRVRAVLRDGRRRDLDVTVPPGATAPPIRLSW